MKRRYLLWIVIASGCTHPATPYCGPDCLPSNVGNRPPKASIATVDHCVQPIPEDAVPAPAGTYVDAWRDQMIGSASQQIRFVERNAWYAGGDQLGPRGQVQVERLAAMHIEAPSAIVIEAEPVVIQGDETLDDAYARTASLNQTRIAAVSDQMQRAGIADADQWIILDTDRGVGVTGIEAPRIFNQQFIRGGRQGGGFGNNRGGGGGGLGGFGGGLGGFGGGLGGFGGGGIF